MRKSFKSLFKKIPVLKRLRIYLFLLFVVMGILPGMIVKDALLNNYEERAIELRLSDTLNQFKVISNHLLTNNYLKDTSSEAINAELEILSDLYDGRVLVINENFKVVKDTYGISEGKYVVSEEVITAFGGSTTYNYDDVLGYIEMTVPISGVVTQDGEEVETVQGVMLVSVSTNVIEQTLEILRRQGSIVTVVVSLCVIAISFVLSFLLVRPVSRVAGVIRDAKNGLSFKPEDLGVYQETRDIAVAFNELYTQMKAVDDSRQEFVANVSHELKTPLTSMKVLADSILQMDEVPAEVYREFMEDITTEIDRENEIINDLLSLVKMDRTAAQLEISTVDINELIESVLKRLSPIAEQRDVELVFESIRPVTAEVDEIKISQVVTNLVENAIKYNQEHGWVKVLLDADHQFFLIQVSDSGIGIPKEDQDQIFERFYRVDKSHSREIGGTGLGLSIARNAVLLHRGSINVSSEEGKGTTFVVKIPLTYVKS